MSRRPARLSAAETCARVSLAARAGSGALPSSSRASGASRSCEGLQRGGEVAAAAGAAAAGPARVRSQISVLWRAGQHLEALHARAVARHGPQLVGVGADHVGQHVRVAGVALGPGHAKAVPEPGGLQRVHPEHHVPGRGQRGHPRPAVGLDPDLDLRPVSVLAQVLSDQPVQPGHPGRTLRQPPPCQHPARSIHQLHVVMVLSPVIPHEQRINSPSEKP